MSNSNRSSNYLANTRRMSGITTLSGKKLFKDSKANDNYVNVAVRCRPMSEKEFRAGHQSIVEFESKTRIIVHDSSVSPSDQLGTKSGERKNFSHVYDFDAVFDFNSKQQEIYNQVCKPIVDGVLEGYNGTIFAYGQTGTGKTYTMEGSSQYSLPIINSRQQTSSAQQSKANHQINLEKRGVSAFVSPNSDITSSHDNDSMGMIPRAFKQIFDFIEQHPQIQFLIRASYLEIYQEEIHDLLRKDRSIKLDLHERPDDGVYVKDLTSFVCKSITEIERVMRVGNQNRMVGATDMNERSSRSHAIFMIAVEQQSTINPEKTTENDMSNQHEANKPERVIKVGKLNLVDLAGSERQRKTNSLGQRQKESIKINLSLSALGNVINSLMKIHTQQQQSSNIDSKNSINSNSISGFTPYRDSKLTRLLQDSLGGNSKTLMIANIGPASYNYDETINTLNYASRAKCIKNRPRLNEDPKDALLRKLQQEIDELRTKLASMNDKSNQNFGSIDKKSGYLNETEQKSNREARNNASVERELATLKQKLSSLESKLLNGYRIQLSDTGSTLNQNLLQGFTQSQEQELEKKRVELANQAQREKAIRDELEKREEAELLVLESFSSIQQEVDAKKKLIRQILLKIKSIRDELEGTQTAYRLELDELDQLQYVLQKELKLKCLIMDNFIPNTHVDQLLSRVVFDEKRNSCSVIPVDLRLDECNIYSANNQETGNFFDSWKLSAQQNCIRPRSEFEYIGETIYPSNIRYKYENLFEPKLEFRSCSGLKKLGIRDNNLQDDDNQADTNLTSSKIQALIDGALNEHEPDIVI